MGRDQRSNNFFVAGFVWIYRFLRSHPQLVEAIWRALEPALQQIAQRWRAELPDREHHLGQHRMTPQMCTEDYEGAAAGHVENSVPVEQNDGREQRSNNFFVEGFVRIYRFLRSHPQLVEAIWRALEPALQQIAQRWRAELPDREHHLGQHSRTPQMCTEGTPDSSHMQLLLQQERPDILERRRSRIFTQNVIGGTVAEQETGADFRGGNSGYTDLNLPRQDPRRTGASPRRADDQSRQVDLTISDSRRAQGAHCNADSHNRQADLPRSDPGSADGSITEADLQNSDPELVDDADVGVDADLDEGATEGHVEIAENSVQDVQNDRRPEYVQEVDSGFDSPTTNRMNPPVIGGTVAEQETGADFRGGNSGYTDLNLPRQDPRRTGASPRRADDQSRQVDLTISDSRRAQGAHCNADSHNRQADLPRSDPGSADGSITEADLQNSDPELVDDADVGVDADLDEGATEGHVEIAENSVQDVQNDRRPEYVQEVDSGFDSPTTNRMNPPGEQTAVPNSDVVPEEEEDREMGRPWQPD